VRWEFPYRSTRRPILARNVVATSQPLATQAGLRMLLQGGNAVDAAVAAAITLTVVEPVMNGIGGDAFALVWDGARLSGLNGSGRSPASWTHETFAGRDSMPTEGWPSATVPGAVSAWAALSSRFGALPFDALCRPAVEYARDGFLVAPVIAGIWQSQVTRLSGQPGFAEAFLPGGRAPAAGEWFRCPDQARTLEAIGQTRGESFYRGDLAKKIAAFGDGHAHAMTEADLASHQPDWVEPIGQRYHDHVVHEMPPNGQGLAALIALGILERVDGDRADPDSADGIHLQVEAMKLAFADVHAHVSDPATMRMEIETLLDSGRLASLAASIRRDTAHAPVAGPEPSGTVYLTTADAQGMMVSFIQSNYLGFGSGLVVPGTGISLHDRGAGFSLHPRHPNCVGPRKRPFHTIIPSFVTRGGQPVMSFGVMGADMQPQGHLQIAARVLGHGQNPQAALDAPRWKIAQDGTLLLDDTISASCVRELSDRGHAIRRIPPESLDFGAGQAIYRLDEGYVGASESRRDGQASGF
jgi:gamma-glutamyltranspeptidase/glutathione hydrolase